MMSGAVTGQIDVRTGRAHPPYPDSGVKWLEEVPGHWEVRRLKTICDMRSGDTITAMSIEEDGDYPVYGGNGLRGYASAYTHDGDYVLVGRQGALCGNIHLAHGRFWASEHAVVATLDKGHVLHWFGALLNVMNLNQYSIAAAQPGLAVDRVLNLWAPVPPAGEQAAIARFLDHADGRIRRYIRAKQHLIELLEEERQAIIHQAVTGQINVRTGQPYPAYKDSGVEWLGEVPEHWEVRRLGTFGRFFKGSGGTKADETERGIPCVRYGDLYTRHRFHITAARACVAPERTDVYTPIRYGDVLFAGSGETLAEIGKSAANLVKGPVVCGSDVIGFRPTIDVDAKFIGWSTDCQQAASQKARTGRGITVMHIYSGDLKYLAVSLPPLSEQTVIARFLDCADRCIQRHIAAAKRQIALLREYRTRLIADVVTGKLDVREAAADLPVAESLTGHEPGQ